MFITTAQLGAQGARGATGLTGAIGATGPQGPQGPAGVSGPAFRTEVDNGTEFAVSGSPSLADTLPSGATYADAGVVVDAGTTQSLTASSLAVTFQGSTPDVNIWIGNGPQAATNGVYPLSSVDFCYGLGQDYSAGVPGSFYMTGKNCGSYAGQTLNVSQIASDFGQGDYSEAYIWAGLVAPQNGVFGGQTYITSVDGVQVNEAVGIINDHIVGVGPTA